MKVLCLAFLCFRRKNQIRKATLPMARTEPTLMPMTNPGFCMAVDSPPAPAVAAPGGFGAADTVLVKIMVTGPERVGISVVCSVTWMWSRMSTVLVLVSLTTVPGMSMPACGSGVVRAAIEEVRSDELDGAAAGRFAGGEMSLAGGFALALGIRAGVLALALVRPPAACEMVGLLVTSGTEGSSGPWLGDRIEIKIFDRVEKMSGLVKSMAKLQGGEMC